MPHFKKCNKVMYITLPMTASSFDNELDLLDSASASTGATVRISSLENHIKNPIVFKYQFSTINKRAVSSKKKL